MKNILYYIAVGALLVATKVFAQSTPILPADDGKYGLDNLGKANLKLGTKDIANTSAGIINIALGLLGMLATVIILMGGFKWMTSRGNRDQVDEAKKLIAAGVIGLIIILTAYAVARFVLIGLQNATVKP